MRKKSECFCSTSRVRPEQKPCSRPLNCSSCVPINETPRAINAHRSVPGAKCGISQQARASREARLSGQSVFLKRSIYIVYNPYLALYSSNQRQRRLGCCFNIVTCCENHNTTTDRAEERILNNINNKQSSFLIIYYIAALNYLQVRTVEKVQCNAKIKDNLLKTTIMLIYLLLIHFNLKLF